MKHHVDLTDLFAFLASLNMAVTALQKKQMEIYLDLLHRWSARQNLVSRSDLRYLVERHFLPSLYLHVCLPKHITGALMDLGSGAGFPGILIAIMRPGLKITLLDSSRKKTLFLKEVCDTASLTCEIICKRCEIHQQHTQVKYQIIVARAVAGIDVLLNWTTGLQEKGGILYALKGGDDKRETEKHAAAGEDYIIYRPDSIWTAFSKYMCEKYVLAVER